MIRWRGDGISEDLTSTRASTAIKQFWITSKNSRTNLLQFRHYDNNFYLSDSLLKINQDDTVYVSLAYSPFEADNHYDVLIIDDIANNKSKFITIVGEGVESLITDRDNTIPWRLKLHPILLDSESDTIDIKYDVPEKNNVNITIFNYGGRPIKTIANGTVDVGFYTFNWDGSNDKGSPIEGGEYLCVMQAGIFIQIQHILLLR